MWRHRGPKKPKGEPGSGDLAQECELFLSGRYVECVRPTGRTMPAWVRVNPLAHGSVDDLIALSSVAGDRLLGWDWAGVIGQLAMEILAAVGDDAARLYELQREVLIPLELRLADDAVVVLHPAQLAQVVSRELERH